MPWTSQLKKCFHHLFRLKEPCSNRSGISAPSQPARSVSILFSALIPRFFLHSFSSCLPLLFHYDLFFYIFVSICQHLDKNKCCHYSRLSNYEYICRPPFRQSICFKLVIFSLYLLPFGNKYVIVKFTRRTYIYQNIIYNHRGFHYE